MSSITNQQQQLSLLHTFSVAARHLSFTKAAEELFLTQGGVSQRIKKLEMQLQFNLFIRKTRKLELTPEGQRVLSVLSSSFESIFSTLSDIQTGELTGSLHIATSPYFASAWLIPKLPSLRQLYPNLSIKLQTKQNQSDFQFEPYDVAIFYSQGRYPNHYSERLFSGKRTPVCSVDYAAEHGLHNGLSALSDVNFIHRGDTSAWQYWLDEMNVGIDCEKRCDFYSDNRLAMEAAELSLGIFLARYEFALPLIQAGRLVAPFPHIESGKGYDLVCPKGMETRAKFQAFSRWVHSELDNE
ncbi:LysR substrate-binding domain-containing protein [Vibrio alginolyticus]|uniref:LysR substrate-binding domain-containing protein n=1 Tax=Vibrio TaxID=662 RepID=UPI001E54136D|nr:MULTISPECIES: LysR substrate-binding domain-containing protein [Vibrio]EGQ9177655.1 LysR family transcriptional regulator [Vibrio alginolyticus]EGQ9764888.1 LysR family transcriptional regulator [Vibrio alginolyticus]EJN3359247.1 LysR family transcriptional regulator [Vibrio alginolyticus]EJS0372982.1 LysR family transcriptional regulator [Vibrio alginolyticus]EKY4876491.1 LysR family transcriptional regulator [Vibrio alginolyticus]